MAKSLPTTLQLLRFNQSHHNFTMVGYIGQSEHSPRTRSSRPPPRACSRQVSTDQSRKQVVMRIMRLRMVTMMGLKMLAMVMEANCMTGPLPRLSKLRCRMPFIMRNRESGLDHFYHDHGLHVSIIILIITNMIIMLVRMRTAVPGPRSIALKKELNSMQVPLQYAEPLSPSSSL